MSVNPRVRRQIHRTGRRFEPERQEALGHATLRDRTPGRCTFHRFSPGGCSGFHVCRGVSALRAYIYFITAFMV